MATTNYPTVPVEGPGAEPWSCAVKQLGMENSPADELMKTLKEFEKQ